VKNGGQPIIERFCFRARRLIGVYLAHSQLGNLAGLIVASPSKK
jgi:hypothetical protein